ncbi:MAG: hypothetical protein J7623_01630 [Chitinophaga sp.]|uniref:hypothetical protein n=1 Tax=Chitinophaga sp. TaxID=1869181 RepID=UPI001B2E93F7|nr:hypothetical protein [Chitinophaga sp.]MBO9727316.1 hypothetical protein [Chitinophaga sp.]
MAIEASKLFNRTIFTDNKYKWYLWIGVPSILVQLTIFKYFYPFAGFINGDSFVYLESAYHNFSINTYPIGYSKFLRLFSVFTKSDTALVAFQYLLSQFSMLYFLFSIFYIYNPSRVTRILLFAFLIFNPVLLYLANYVSSDSIFFSLSLIWITQLIWICYEPTSKTIILNAIILGLLFTIRYNALYYPIIQGVALLMTRYKLWIKIAGFSLSVVLIMLFVQFTSYRYYKLTEIRQFSPFTGWQLANNGMYAYRFVDSAHVKKAPPRLQKIDRMVRTYFDTTRDVKKHPTETLIASTVYMWDPKSPLSLYMESQFKKDSSATALKKWASVAPMMKEYGTFLIQQYPNEFFKYYLIPNALKYYAPPVEFLSTYSTGVDSVNYMATVWFDYPTNKIRTRFKDFNVSTLNFYPVFTGTMNVILVFSLLSFVILKGYKEYPVLKTGLILVFFLWATNFGFSVFASPIALRFQLLPIIVSSSYAFLLIEFLVIKAMEKETRLNIEPAVEMEIR